ncbi:MAG: DUF333 domain-containing protein [Parcubacteria group bacterium]|nr:DUF333 domain-containing protein [Parcubacteria group bacterium]
MPDEPEDDVSIFLLKLKRESGITFGEIVDVEFNWNLEQGGDIRGSVVAGKRFEALGILPDNPIKIKEFFEEDGFVVDVHNVTAGTIVGLDGYRKDAIVCSVRGGVTGGEEGLDAEIVTEDVIVSCGEIEVEETEEIAGLANPASVYCKNNGGKLIHILGVGGVAGYCILPDERVCQQWNFFYSEGGECVAPEVEFVVNEDCSAFCEETGRPAGNCKMLDEMEEGEVNLGACHIPESSTFCGLPGKCYCGC